MSNDNFKNKLNRQHEGGVHDQLIDPNPNVSNNPNVDEKDKTEVNVVSIPVVKAKKTIRETHKTKAFYIRNDIAKLIERDIRKGKRGEMTTIVNALFEEYYKSQGLLK